MAMLIIRALGTCLGINSKKNFAETFGENSLVMRVCEQAARPTMRVGIVLIVGRDDPRSWVASR